MWLKHAPGHIRSRDFRTCAGVQLRDLHRLRNRGRKSPAAAARQLVALGRLHTRRITSCVTLVN